MRNNSNNMTAFSSIIIFITTFISFALFGQQISFNKFDSKGKKTGYWKIYIDENAMPIDSANAFFWGFEFYDKGKKNSDAFVKHKKSKNLKYVFEGFIPPKGRPIAIDGVVREYQTTKDKNVLFIEESYKNGFPQLFKQYFGEEIWVTIDFTKKFNDTEGSYFVIDYLTYFISFNNKKKTSSYWVRKVNNKWKAVKVEPQNGQ